MITNQSRGFLYAAPQFRKREKEWVPKFWHSANFPPCSRKALAHGLLVRSLDVAVWSIASFSTEFFYFLAIFTDGSNKNEFCSELFSVVLIKHFLSSVEARNCEFRIHFSIFASHLFWFEMWGKENNSSLCWYHKGKFIS